jgi:hypothetical protein
MGLHLGEGQLRAAHAPGAPEDYVGIDVNYAARIAAAGNGGQIVLSDALVATLPRGLTRLAGLADVELVDDGPRAVKDFEEPVPLYRLVVPGAADDSRALRTTEVPTNLPGEVTTLVGRRTRSIASEPTSRAGSSRWPDRAAAARPGSPSRSPEPLATSSPWRLVRDLAALRDRSSWSPIAVALGVRETPDRRRAKPSAPPPERTVLLVLDNLEQLLPAAAETITGLVRGAPGLRPGDQPELLRVSASAGTGPAAGRRGVRRPVRRPRPSAALGRLGRG